MKYKKLIILCLCGVLGFGTCYEANYVPIYANTMTDANDWGTNGNGTNETTDSNNRTSEQMQDHSDENADNAAQGDQAQTDSADTSSLQLSENRKNEQSDENGEESFVQYTPGKTNLKEMGSLKGVHFALSLNDLKAACSDPQIMEQMKSDVSMIAEANGQTSYDTFDKMIIHGADTAWWEDADTIGELRTLVFSESGSFDLSTEMAQNELILYTPTEEPEHKDDPIDVKWKLSDSDENKDAYNSRAAQIADILGNNRSLVGALMDIHDSKGVEDFDKHEDRSTFGEFANSRSLAEALSSLSGSDSKIGDILSEKSAAGAILNLLGYESSDSDDKSSKNSSDSSDDSKTSGFADFLRRESLFGDSDKKSLIGNSDTALGQKSLFGAIAKARGKGKGDK